MKNPSMNWLAKDLDKEFKRFKQHCSFTFEGPLEGKTEKQKVNYLMTYIGDRGRELYNTFTWTPAVAQNGQQAAVPAENETLEGVFNKYERFLAPTKNQIRASWEFQKRKQQPSERFDNFVTDLRILVRDCGYAEPNRMLRDAIVQNTSYAEVREKCLDAGDELSLEQAIKFGQNHEIRCESLKLMESSETSCAWDLEDSPKP